MFLLGIAGFLLYSNAHLYKRGTDFAGQAGLLQAEVVKLERQNEELQSRLAKTNTQEYLEKAARERMNLKKPGEEVVAVIAPKEKDDGQKKLEEKSIWRKIWEKIESLAGD
ncbi:MAG: hypothetical protein A3I38_00135 [Candidatus Wildermuthbacteria bacterium RIFCSPLOWO2_02_FULL_47_10]|nr:MAG: hypothetical protein A3D59_02215 [Candidatus Wildermuthbacteria bacterium RIFCSPHIGHO2_02_FULL_47_17]OHA76467.1 MAG: hypothetical protein A3I38_00135 [Candidatus Wildermuthbacteria bacterium RIFCSPLOWO2_02_FULL_47_10]